MRKVFLNFIASVIITIFVFFLVIFFVHISDSTNIMVSVGITVSLQISFLTAVLLAKNKKK